MVLFLVLILLPVAVAWIHYLAVGLPEVPVIPQQPPRVSERPGRLPGLAPYHALRQLPFHYPAPPQRTIHSDGPSSTLSERSLHARIGVDAIHPSRGPHESSLYGEGRRPLHFALARSARLRTYHWYGPALALALCLVLVPQRAGFRGVALRQRPVEGPSAGHPGKSFRTPGRSSCTTPPFTCRSSRMATVTMPSSNCLTSLRSLSWLRSWQ